MKVELKESSNSIGMNQLLIGEMGKIISGNRQDLLGHIILRTYSGCVDLNNPELTWSDPIDDNSSIKLKRKIFKLVEIQD